MSAVYNFQAEDEARSAALRSWGINVTKPDAKVVPLGHPARKPLGLRPASSETGRSDTDDVSGGDSLAVNLADCDQAHLDAPATVGLIYETLNGAASMVDTVNRKLKARIVELETENARDKAALAELRAQFAEAKAEFAEAKHILERLQVSREGKRGERGPCGADGPAGMRGERGPRGETGSPAPIVAAWETRAENFQIVPVFANGERGVPINLRPFFEVYDAATNELDDRDIVSAAEASRMRVEAEAEAVRQGRPR
jgi:hypothetical protein